MKMLGKRGTGGLYVVVDIFVAIAVFTLLYLGADDYLSNHVLALTADHDDPYTLIDTEVGAPWSILPIGFLVSLVMRTVYGRDWSNTKSMMYWILIVSGLFIFNVFYIGSDYWVSDYLPGLIAGEITEADDFLNDWMLRIWDALPWMVHLGLCFWGVFYIDRTPEGRYVDYGGGR